jgi:hypothetical protein
MLVWIFNWKCGLYRVTVPYYLCSDPLKKDISVQGYDESVVLNSRQTYIMYIQWTHDQIGKIFMHVARGQQHTSY